MDAEGSSSTKTTERRQGEERSRGHASALNHRSLFLSVQSKTTKI